MAENPTGIAPDSSVMEEWDADWFHYFPLLLHQSTEGMALSDINGIVRFANRAFASAHGFVPQDVIGKHKSIFHSPGQMASVDAANREVREKGVFTGEVWHLRRDGTEFPALMQNSLLRDESGNPIGVIVTLRDITERKEAERSLLRQTRELEIRNQELDAFAQTVAHDIKNPLGLISSMIDMLKRKQERISKEEIGEYLEALQRNVWRLLNITDELLVLAQMRKEEVSRKPLDMKSIVEHSLERLKHLIEQYDARIVTPGRWPLALGHSPWIEEVWMNYISNAIKYGGQPPCAELGAQPQSNGMIRYWVRDNGTGLSREQREALFAPFVRFDQIGIQGYGLGLSIVRNIVEKLGGEVGVERSDATGSTFFFTLQGVDLGVRVE